MSILLDKFILHFCLLAKRHDHIVITGNLVTNIPIQQPIPSPPDISKYSFRCKTRGGLDLIHHTAPVHRRGFGAGKVSLAGGDITPPFGGHLHSETEPLPKCYLIVPADKWP